MVPADYTEAEKKEFASRYLAHSIEQMESLLLNKPELDNVIKPLALALTGLNGDKVDVMNELASGDIEANIKYFRIAIARHLSGKGALRV